MSEKERNFENIKGIALEWGASVFGVGYIGDLHDQFYGLPAKVTEGLVNGISMGIRVSGRVLEDIVDSPTKLYYYHYRRLNISLDQMAIMVMNHIQCAGYNALPIASSQTIEWEEHRGHFPHKTAGVRAGLGWLGRNNLIVHPEYGSHVRYVTVLTDMPLGTGSEIESECGECRACVEACPAGALGETYREYNKQACLEKLREFMKKNHIGQYICGVCVKMCKGGRL